MIFIGDTVAYFHMAGSLEGIIDLKNIDEDITFGNVQATRATNTGKNKVLINLENEKKPRHHFEQCEIRAGSFTIYIF